jgi:hypothetical protein
MKIPKLLTDKLNVDTLNTSVYESLGSDPPRFVALPLVSK